MCGFQYKYMKQRLLFTLGMENLFSISFILNLAITKFITVTDVSLSNLTNFVARSIWHMVVLNTNCFLKFHQCSNYFCHLTEVAFLSIVTIPYLKLRLSLNQCYGPLLRSWQTHQKHNLNDWMMPKEMQFCRFISYFLPPLGDLVTLYMTLRLLTFSCAL